MTTVVQVENLHKAYGKVIAVENVSFAVQEGEIFGMVGSNGAGKTTIIECLEGLRQADGGFLRVLGLDPQRQGRSLRAQLGIQLQDSRLPDRMKVWEALDLYASFYSSTVDWRTLLPSLGLAEKWNTPFAKLSGGQQQRLFIALALLPNPRLVFLDELTTGLDPHARRAIWDLVRDIRSRGTTIFLTTHFMEEAERLCDRVAILDHGRIVALDAPDALIRSLGAAQRVVFQIEGSLPPSVEKALRSVGDLEVHGEQVTVYGDHRRRESPIGEVVSILNSHKVHFRDLRTEQSTLEDVFLKLTGRKLREGGAS